MQEDVTKTTHHFDSALNGGSGSNRLALKMRPDGLLARRSASSFAKLMESIKAAGLIIPNSNRRAINDAGSSHTISNKARFSTNVDDALEVVTEWLEELATSDHILFRQVRALIKEAGIQKSPS